MYSAVSVNIAKGLVLTTLGYIPQGDSVSQCMCSSFGYTVKGSTASFVFGFGDGFGQGGRGCQASLRADGGDRRGRRRVGRGFRAKPKSGVYYTEGPRSHLEEGVRPGPPYEYRGGGAQVQVS